MNASPVVTLREAGADLSRLTDRSIALLQRGADAVARWAWIKAYERAEAIYWPQGKEQCK